MLEYGEKKVQKSCWILYPKEPLPDCYGENEKDKICLFISLIDVFYDADVRVVISSAEPVAEIYTRGFMIMEYTRTNSRLAEMQSSDYFAGEFTRHENK